MTSIFNRFSQTVAALIAAVAISGPVIAQDAVTDALTESRMPLVYDGETFSGEGWDFLITEADSAQYFLIGEEHGIAENPILAADLFIDAGFEKLVIEVSPFIADLMDTTLKDGGWDALRDMFADKRKRPAFFGMTEEAVMLADIRAALPDADQVFWGVDYEVVGDGVMLAALAEFEKSQAAEEALENVTLLSEEGWQAYEDTGNPLNIFSFSNAADAVTELRMAWTDPPAEAAGILETLEETQLINGLFMSGQGWASNNRRAAFLRSNFLRHWKAAESSPRVMLKLGASHLIRGRNPTKTFDLGTLVPEIAEIEGVGVFSILVLPGEDAMTAVLDPVTLTYGEAPGKDGYSEGLDLFFDAAFEDGFTVLDMRSLRPLSGKLEGENAAKLTNIIHGFDAVVVMTGSQPSGNVGDWKAE